MKKVTFVTMLLVLAATNTFAASYSGSLSGQPLWRAVEGIVGWAGTSAGTPDAEFNVSLNWSNGQPALAGGDWTLTFSSVDSQGVRNYLGALRGTISSGTITLDSSGEITSITNAELTIVAGYGSYAGITAGTGTLTASISTDSQPFRGSITLSY